jgi:hypothetical protein
VVDADAMTAVVFGIKVQVTNGPVLLVPEAVQQSYVSGDVPANVGWKTQEGALPFWKSLQRLVPTVWFVRHRSSSPKCIATSAVLVKTVCHDAARTLDDVAMFVR